MDDTGTEAMESLALLCPVCDERFPTTASTQVPSFARHLAACTMTMVERKPLKPHQKKPPRVDPLRQCSMCPHVFEPTAWDQDIEFHEFECARVNDRPPPAEKKQKTTEASKPMDEEVVSSTPSLFPSLCDVCGHGGRQLLHCRGACVRSFHATCLQLPSSIMREKELVEQWQCPECIRSVHACAQCGYLGHDMHDLIACSIVNCGLFFHQQCITMHTSNALYICPRHTCRSCHAVDTKMENGISCTQCLSFEHVSCYNAKLNDQATKYNPALDGHFRICQDHTTPLERKDIEKSHVSLMQQLHVGDLVLVLEYDNALLPPRDPLMAWNQWGIVLLIEALDEWQQNQLLQVELLSDQSIVTMTNRYVLPLGRSIQTFPDAQVLVRQSLTAHTAIEMNLHRVVAHEEVEKHAAKREQVAQSSFLAFKARATALALTYAQLKPCADAGYALWAEHLLPQLRDQQLRFDPAKVPIYSFLDTRPSQKTHQTKELHATQQRGVVEIESHSNGTNASASHSGNGSPPSTTNTTTNSMPSTEGNTSSNHAAPTNEMAVGIPVLKNPQLVVTRMPLPPLLSPLRRRTATTKSFQLPFMAATSKDNKNNDSLVVKRPTWLLDTTTTKIDLDHLMEQTVGSRLIVNTAMVQTDATIDPAPEDDDDDDEAPSKKPRIDAAPATPTTTTTSASTVTAPAPATSTFSGRGAARRKPWQTKKTQRLNETPLVVRQQMESTVASFLQSEEMNEPLSMAHRLPFFRPSVVLNRSRVVDLTNQLEHISRVLLAQDKRELKCYVASPHDNEATCRHTSAITDPTSAAVFVTVDLLAVASVEALYRVVTSQLVAALDQHPAFVQASFHLDPLQTKQWIAMAQKPQTTATTLVQLSYCALDGMRRELLMDEAEEWLSFSANVCHLSVELVFPN